MKIAVASENGMVSKHFGHCAGFVIFEAENNQAGKGISIQSPGQGHGVLPNFLIDLGIDVVIAGGMGGGARKKFSDKDIKVITGTEGSVESAVNSYLAGELKSSGSNCQGHKKHHHDHEEHHHGHKCGCGN